MTDKQQTAVQWLMQQLSYYNPEAHAELIVKGDYADAIEMEEVQHRRSYIHGLASWHSNVKFEDYYKNLFNNE